MTARDDLHTALDELHEHTPCTGEHRADWLSDNPHERATAAEACTPCPVLTLCQALADEEHHAFGVWAGTDRTPGPRRRNPSHDPAGSNP